MGVPVSAVDKAGWTVVEQGHRRIRFKRFDYAAITISGIELAEKIKKRQFKTGKLGSRISALSELWNAALAG